MKILVIGGMHGNEPLGQAVVAMFRARPVQDVDTVLANEAAIAKNCRFTEQDLNRSFPGDRASKIYEIRRAAELLALTKGYDVVLDFHNTQCPDNDCGFVGEAAEARLYDVAWLLGLNKAIVADYDCINKCAPSCLSVEVSLASPANQPDLWYDRIVLLGKLQSFDVMPCVTKFRFVYRMTLADKERLGLPGKNLQAFRALPPVLARAMGVQSPAYPIFIGDGYTPYNYGGLLNKID